METSHFDLDNISVALSSLSTEELEQVATSIRYELQKRREKEKNKLLNSLKDILHAITKAGYRIEFWDESFDDDDEDEGCTYFLDDNKMIYSSVFLEEE